jgi:hypothetical protein
MLAEPSTFRRNLALGALGLVSVCLFLQLKHDLFLRGTDAYYYALQSDFWFRTGKVKIPDSSFIHRLLGLLQYTGLGAENALRLWTTFSVFLFALLAARTAERTRSGAVYAAALAWAILSPTALFCAIEFPKQFSLFLIIGALPLGLRQKESAWSLLLPLWAAAALLLHRAAGVYFIFLLAGVAVFIGFNRIKASDRLRILKAALAVAAVMAGYVFIIGDHAGFSDLLRLSQVRFTPGIISLLLRENLPLAVKSELAVSAALALYLMVGLFKSKAAPARWKIAAFGLLLPAFLPCWGAEVFSAGERFAIFLPLAVLVLLPSLQFATPWREPVKEPGKVFILSLVSVSVVLSICFRLNTAQPLRISPDYAGFQVMVDELNPKAIPMLIAHQGFNFFYKFKTTRESFSYEPEDHWDKRRVWRLLCGLSPSEINYFLPGDNAWENGLVVRLNADLYFLIREDVYERLRGNVTEAAAPDIYALLNGTTLNPSRKRPAFLYAKHKSDDPREEFSAIKQ